MALGALWIYSEYSSYSDEEVVFQIQENPYLQFFCGLPGYTDEQPFDPSLMVYFSKWLTPKIIGEINEMIISANTPKVVENHDIERILWAIFELFFSNSEVMFIQ